MKELLDKKITDVVLSEDRIVFILADGAPISYTPENDCCNDVWFVDFQGEESLKNQIITKVELKPWEDTPRQPREGRTRDSLEEIAFISIYSTGNGLFDFSIRNSSNGYYGGNIWCEQTKKDAGLWPDAEEVIEPESYQVKAQLQGLASGMRLIGKDLKS